MKFNVPETKIIFFHGFQSSDKTNKFTAIEYQNKECLTVDYENLSYKNTYKLHHYLVDKADKEGFIPLLVGHSLGGYWAYVLAQEFQCRSVLINPQLFPRHSDIKDVDKYKLPKNNGFGTYAYIERADEVIDVLKTIDYLESVSAQLHIFNGGHHRVEFIDNINTVRRQINLDFSVFKIRESFGSLFAF